MRCCWLCLLAALAAHAACSTASRGAVSSVASRAAASIRENQAHVEPLFLSGDALASAREDIISVLAQIPEDSSDDFQSVQTDLLNPEFRRGLPGAVPFSALLAELDELRVALAQETGRNFLEGGGFHLMHYPIGGKFMRHVDEDPALYEPVRNSISFLIYLTPSDWTANDGGALCLFDGGDGCAPRQVLPTAGTLVIYDSTIEHEVLPTERTRHLISGRYRELDEDWRRER